MRDSRSPFGSFIPSFLSSSNLEAKTRIDYARYLNQSTLTGGPARARDTRTDGGRSDS